MRHALDLILLLVGIAAIVAGVGMLSVPAAYIASGIFLSALAIFPTRNDSRNKPPRGGA